MNSSLIYANLWRFVLYFLFQVIVCRRVDLSIGSFHYIHLLIYPLPVFMLPMKTPKAMMLIIAFVFGLMIDGFYNSPGVHAAALVFSAYIKSIILRFLEPFEGYNTDDYPTISKMGIGWYLSFISLLMLLHCFIYFSVEAFSFVYFFDIFMNTIFSFITSMSVIFLLQLILRPKY
ncbi:MAG: hypothetical protein IPN29_19390 [Saprospiraceae bacterium]|nr:hypothetical protein [Saprospiraceae bacterium]